jgi:hypothetical protein
LQQNFEKCSVFCLHAIRFMCEPSGQRLKIPLQPICEELCSLCIYQIAFVVMAVFLGVVLHQLIEAIKLQPCAFYKPLGRPTSYRSLLESPHRHNCCYICCFPCHLLALPCAKECVKKGRNGRAMLPQEKTRMSLIDTILMYGPTTTHFHKNACNRFQS